MQNEKTLMDKANEIKKDNTKKEKIYQSMNLDKEKNNIIFDKNNHFFIRFFSLIIDLFSRIFSLGFYIIIFILLAIGATVIINPQTRNIVIEMFNRIFS